MRTLKKTQIEYEKNDIEKKMAGKLLWTQLMSIDLGIDWITNQQKPSWFHNILRDEVWLCVCSELTNGFRWIGYIIRDCVIWHKSEQLAQSIVCKSVSAWLGLAWFRSIFKEWISAYWLLDLCGY